MTVIQFQADAEYRIRLGLNRCIAHTLLQHWIFASVNCASKGSGTTSAVARPEETLQCFQPYGQEGLLVADLDLSTASEFLASRCRTSPLWGDTCKTLILSFMPLGYSP